MAQARYMSSSMWTFALLRDSSDLHIYKDLYGERNKPENNHTQNPSAIEVTKPRNSALDFPPVPASMS